MERQHEKRQNKRREWCVGPLDSHRVYSPRDVRRERVFLLVFWEATKQNATTPVRRLLQKKGLRMNKETVRVIALLLCAGLITAFGIIYVSKWILKDVPRLQQEHIQQHNRRPDIPHRWPAGRDEKPVLCRPGHFRFNFRRQLEQAQAMTPQENLLYPHKT